MNRLWIFYFCATRTKLDYKYMKIKYCKFNRDSSVFEVFNCEIFNIIRNKLNEIRSFNYSVPKLGLKEFTIFNKLTPFNKFKFSNDKKYYYGFFESIQLAKNEFNKWKVKTISHEEN